MYRNKMKKCYDGCKTVKPVNLGDKVWIQTEKQSGTIIGSSNTPRSHLVETDSGVFRRNRSHLTVLPAKSRTTISHYILTFDRGLHINLLHSYHAT